MSKNAHARLPGLSLYLCEQTRQVRRGRGHVFVGELANIDRSYVRSILR